MEAGSGENQPPSQDQGRRGRRNFRNPYADAGYYGMPFPPMPMARDPTAVYRIPTPCWYPPGSEPAPPVGPEGGFYGYPPYFGPPGGGRGRGRRGGGGGGGGGSFHNNNSRQNHQQQQQQQQPPQIEKSETNFPPLSTYVPPEDVGASFANSTRAPISRPPRTSATPQSMAQAIPASSFVGEPLAASSAPAQPAAQETRKSQPGGLSWSTRVAANPAAPPTKSSPPAQQPESAQPVQAAPSKQPASGGNKKERANKVAQEKPAADETKPEGKEAKVETKPETKGEKGEAKSESAESAKSQGEGQAEGDGEWQSAPRRKGKAKK